METATAEVANLMPYPAWVQAVFVCLFIAFVVYYVWITGQQREKDRKFEDQQRQAERQFQKEQNDSWQKFIKESNDGWQQWIDKNNSDTVEAMKQVTEALERLGAQLRDHDKHVEDRVAAAAGEQRTRSRSRTKQ